MLQTPFPSLFCVANGDLNTDHNWSCRNQWAVGSPAPVDISAAYIAPAFAVQRTSRKGVGVGNGKIVKDPSTRKSVRWEHLLKWLHKQDQNKVNINRHANTEGKNLMRFSPLHKEL